MQHPTSSHFCQYRNKRRTMNGAACRMPLSATPATEKASRARETARHRRPRPARPARRPGEDRFPGDRPARRHGGDQRRQPGVRRSRADPRRATPPMAKASRRRCNGPACPTAAGCGAPDRRGRRRADAAAAGAGDRRRPAGRATGRCRKRRCRVATTTAPASRLGRNSYLQASWLPPDPPPGHGVHRYAFQVFALEAGASFDGEPGREAVLEAIREHGLASGCLIGTYERPDTSISVRRREGVPAIRADAV